MQLTPQTNAFALLVTAALTVGIIGCGDESTTTTWSPVRKGPSDGAWTLTVTGVSATGASRCVGGSGVAQAAGAYTESMTVVRWSKGVTFYLPDSPFGLDVPVHGNAFALTLNSSAASLQCPANISQPIVETIEGAFSDDGLSLTAREVDTYHYPDGEVTYIQNWTANHQ